MDGAFVSYSPPTCKNMEKHACGSCFLTHGNEYLFLHLYFVNHMPCTTLSLWYMINRCSPPMCELLCHDIFISLGELVLLCWFCIQQIRQNPEKGLHSISTCLKNLRGKTAQEVVKQTLFCQCPSTQYLSLPVSLIPPLAHKLKYFHC